MNGFLPGVDALAVVVIAHGDHDEIAAAALADTLLIPLFLKKRVGRVHTRRKTN